MPPPAALSRRRRRGQTDPRPWLGIRLDSSAEERLLPCLRRTGTHGPPLELPGNAIRWQAEQHVAVVARGPRSDRRQAVLDEECGSGWGRTRSATPEEVWVCDARMEVAVATFRCDVLSWECHRKINVQFGSARPSIARQAHRRLCRLCWQRTGRPLTQCPRILGSRVRVPAGSPRVDRLADLGSRALEQGQSILAEDRAPSGNVQEVGVVPDIGERLAVRAVSLDVGHVRAPDETSGPEPIEQLAEMKQSPGIRVSNFPPHEIGYNNSAETLCSLSRRSITGGRLSR